MLHPHIVQSLCQKLSCCAATRRWRAGAENRAKSLKAWGKAHEPVSRCAAMSVRMGDHCILNESPNVLGCKGLGAQALGRSGPGRANLEERARMASIVPVPLA